LFALLAVGPLLTVGVFDYIRSRRLIENLIATQTDTIARRAAGTIRERYGVIASDILLLSENADIQRFLGARAIGDSVLIRAAHDTTARFLESAWRVDSASYYSAEWRDLAGEVLFRFSSDAESDRRKPESVVTTPLRDVTGGRVVGSLTLALRLDNLLGPVRFGPAFGRTGDLLVIDRTSGRIIRPELTTGLTARDLLGAAWTDVASASAAAHGTVHYGEAGDSARVATFANLADPAWTVVSSTAVAEFAGAFDRTRTLDALFLLLLAVVVAAAFTVLVSRATRSLEQLTRAAAIVAQGDLSPSLPRPTADEMGTLSSAFAHMVERVRSMMREIAVSRQLAVLGEFAAHLSHEVRNPLTSLKLDLQGMQRQVRTGILAESSAPAIDSALREVNRLDSVVQGVLELARQAPMSRTRCSVHEAVDRAIAVVRAQLAARNIHAELCLHAVSVELDGDIDLLTGLFINLLLNASDAQPGGGTIGILSANRDAGDTRWADVTIADDGPGIAAELREDVFRPFYTSRHDGTGLGLPLALRTAREHGGHIDIGVTPAGYRGAAFIVSLPVVSA
jgi:signal transduction histidine kinase